MLQAPPLLQRRDSADVSKRRMLQESVRCRPAGLTMSNAAPAPISSARQPTRPRAKGHVSFLRGLEQLRVIDVAKRNGTMIVEPFAANLRAHPGGPNQLRGIYTRKQPNIVRMLLNGWCSNVLRPTVGPPQRSLRNDPHAFRRHPQAGDRRLKTNTGDACVSSRRYSSAVHAFPKADRKQLTPGGALTVPAIRSPNSCNEINRAASITCAYGSISILLISATRLLISY